MPSASDHERGLARFLLPARQARFIDALAAGGKRRAKELARLAAQSPVDHRFARTLQADGLPDLAVCVASLDAAIRRVAPTGTGYVVSDDPSLDGATLPAGEALGTAISTGSVVLISFIPGEVAVFLAEAPSEPVLLRRALDD